jgi:hypothetical protein
MSVVRNNHLLVGASGALGKNVVYKQWRGRVVMANMPKKRKGSSEKQIQQQDRFKAAVTFAKRAIAHPQWKAMYEKGINEKENKFSANAVALSDYLNPPTIGEINVLNYTGAPGELIRIRAWDDFRVASVHVTITRNNVVIEEGKALPRGKKGLWRLMTTVRNESAPGTVITVVANDMAGNSTTKTVTIPLAGMAAGAVEADAVQVPGTKENVGVQQEERKPKLSEAIITRAPMQRDGEETWKTEVPGQPSVSSGNVVGTNKEPQADDPLSRSPDNNLDGDPLDSRG